MRPGKRDQIGASGGEDGVHLVRGGDRADAHGGDMRLVANAVRERRLEHASVHRLAMADGLPRRDVHQIDAVLGEGAGDRNGFLRR